ncbi:hypothetical protein J2T13_001099 [Paenibacillus sp. DS2015]
MGQSGKVHKGTGTQLYLLKINEKTLLIQYFPDNIISNTIYLLIRGLILNESSCNRFKTR